MEVSPRPAVIDDLDGVTDTLTRSFHDDPMMAWCFPDAEIRPRRLATMWRFLAEGLYLPGGACTTLPDHDAVALWRHPDDDRQEPFWAENSDRFVTLMEGDLERMGELSELMGDAHPTVPHWYLLAIGVSPASQGRGLGSVLLAHTLELVDQRGEPAYLEATSARSRVLYERFGFEATDELVPDGSPPMWPMWREPARRPAADLAADPAADPAPP